MKKRELVRLLLANGFHMERDSQRHERYRNGDELILVGRHDWVASFVVRRAKAAIARLREKGEDKEKEKAEEKRKNYY